MSTGVAVAEWIKRIADDERRRDVAHSEQTAIAARKADLVNRQGRRLLNDLHAVMLRDVGAFRDEFTGDNRRDVIVDAAGVDGGFAVRKPAPSAVSLTLTPNLSTATLLCAYTFTPTDGLPSREDRIQIMLIETGDESLRMKDNGTGRTYANADDLSEFLLTPVLTGRPR